MSTLTLALVVALASLGPPVLPPEPTSDHIAPPQSDDATEQQPDAAHTPPESQPQPQPQAPPRSSLPPGLQPVPFPLEQQRRPDANTPNWAPPTGADGPPLQPQPPPQRRSIVDLRDPFDRPPPRQRTPAQLRELSRMLMPDLKDPFAQGVRKVRSTTLDRHVPNDIRDPFRARPPIDRPRPACTQTTADGTVIQAPGRDPAPRDGTGELPACKQSELDLHDPFTRQPAPE